MKSGQFKTYLLLGLIVVAAMVAYFRFIHKGAENGVSTQQEHVVKSESGLPVFSDDTSEKRMKARAPFFESVPPPVGRDIFSPLKWPKPKGRPAPEAETEPEPVVKEEIKPKIKLRLLGTIVGGANPIAIINDRYLRLGEWIEEFEVVEITKSTVLLKADDEEILLEVSKGVVTK